MWPENRLTAHSHQSGDDGSVLRPTDPWLLRHPSFWDLVLTRTRPEDCLVLIEAPETCSRLSFRLRRGHRFRFAARKCGLQVDKQEAATAGPGARGVGGGVKRASLSLSQSQKEGSGVLGEGRPREDRCTRGERERAL